MPAAFDPIGIEQPMYQRWKDAGYFAPEINPDGEPFVIVMPPPNVTGELHVGHALFVSLQDLMIRWRRMSGDAALWTPGADHAGIAGQWVVERLIAQEGLTRHDLGREAFVERVWEYMDRLRYRIEEQTSILGASCDWNRYTFTMDAGPSRAVRTVFKHLFDKGLIYRGSRLISWCPRCMTALSDLEVVHKEVESHLWSLAYPVDGEPGRSIVVATTRPETMLGDTAVAVHPDDERYQDLIGKSLILPILGRLIPVVADEAVDREFGSGAVKVTPAHDPNDFEIGKRHDLPAIVILNPDGTLNASAGPFEGMQIGPARAAVVERLEADGALVGIVPHSHAVGHCDRCGTVVQPTISEQWFVSMDSLAAPAIEAARSGELQFVPERFKGVYLNWMENIHDWCISRQLWWGHRIPVWYCQSCGEMIVTVEEHLESCPSCGGLVEQDPDVLDTWFSSGLWPFSTLGWPDDTADLRRYYPSDVMETGYEILFFWVARMVFFGLEIMGELPFHTVYLHGTVRDTDGLKMSKTKGNVLDPTEITATYGADALRFALVTQGSPGLDMRLSMTLVESSRNFINKMWNATRFALRAIDEVAVEMAADGPARPTGDLALADRWIISRLDSVTQNVDRLFGSYLFGEAGRQLREFVWSELCDWYIEAAKVRMRGTDAEKQQVAQTLAYVLERSMRLLHPFMPFATEAMWLSLPHQGESVMVASWPAPGTPDKEAETDWNRLSDLVVKIRNARAETGIEAGKWIPASIHASTKPVVFADSSRELVALARLDAEALEITCGAAAPADGDIVVVGEDVVAILPLSGLVDVNEERERLQKDLEEAKLEKSRAEAQLGNASFVERAPAQVVQVQRDRLAGAIDKIAVLNARLDELARLS
ncbi:MAG: valine--tRNA ligase [Thermomicrobiales bacterium]|nr:valine--tRNA ligase [Thermomicrobiales bacterium]